MKTKRQEQLEAMLDEEPDDPFIHYALALELFRSDELAQYQAKLEWLRENHSSYLATYFQLGKWYAHQGEILKAINVYTSGMILAEEQKNNKTLLELKGALEELEE